MLYFNLQVKNGVSGDDWRWLANDDEINHVDEKEAGKFDKVSLTDVIAYIIEHVDAQSEFKVRLAK